MATTQTLTIVFMDGQKDILERSSESPSLFIHEAVLNVKGRYRTTDEFEWYYFPLCNIRTYATHTVASVVDGGVIR